jgi:hypothetical protein
MRIIIGFFLIIMTCFQLSAQEKQKLIRITGHVVTIEDSSKVAFVNVLNITHPSGTICDLDGKFILLCHFGDTLQFSAVGYEKTYYTTDRLDPSINEHSVTIRLLTAIYMLPSVNVMPFSSSEGLKRVFQSTPLNEKDVRELALRKKLKIKPEEVGANPEYGISFNRIASLIYSLFSKKAKINKKYRKLLHGESINSFIDRRFNAKVVAKIIGHDDRKLIGDFMEQCQLSVDFLITANDYNLYLAIKQNWQHYSSKHNIK